jgi:acyl-CoA thioesterase YciA
VGAAAAAWETLLKTITMPADIDASGQVPTGWLLARMDLAGAVLPGRHFGGPVQLVGLSGVALQGRPRLGQCVTFKGLVASADGEQVVLSVEAFSEERGQVGEALLLRAQLLYTRATVEVLGNIFPGSF